MPITNYKCGITVALGGTEGVNHAVEHPYFDKIIYDLGQVVYIREDTNITMSHNATNTASLGGRGKSVIGTSNPSGDGQIRYGFDELWRQKRWSHPDLPVHPAYTAPFALADIDYDSGAPVVGTLGGRSGYSSTSAQWWNYGLSDLAGDEYHVMRYADDDTGLGGDGDSLASDGKYLVFVVNPKTPCLTVEATGSGAGAGQFYTTPIWTYHVPKIHEQTTYFQGTCNFTLRNIYGGNVFYRIGGGSFIDAGASFVVLNQSHFATGNNTLQYYYAGNAAYTKTRQIVKNPAFPSAAEVHGDRLWGAPNWAKMAARINRAPYNVAALPTSTADEGFDTLKRTGIKFGASSTNWPYTAQFSGRLAVKGRLEGFDEVPPGASLSWIAAAKAMMMESTLNNSPVGFEISSGEAVPNADSYHRGYWDVIPAMHVVTAYDVIAGHGRSNQVEGGMTPIEDYLMRDLLANYVHIKSYYMGPGMWTTAAQVGGTMIACVMSNYSSSYYGSSGVEYHVSNGASGTNAVYQWAPFQTYNTTWAELFLTCTAPVRGFPLGVPSTFGMEGTIADSGLCRVIAPFWADRIAYLSDYQMGAKIQIYANLVALYDDINTGHEPLLTMLAAWTAGTLTGDKSSLPHEEAGVTTTRSPALMCLNPNFPDAAENATAWAQTEGEDVGALYGDKASGGVLSLFLYDDTYYGGDASARPIPTPAPRIFENPVELPVLLTLECPTIGSTIYYTDNNTAPSVNVSEVPQGSTQVYSGEITINETKTVRAFAKTPGGAPSLEFLGVYQIGTLGRPAPPSGQSSRPV